MVDLKKWCDEVFLASMRSVGLGTGSKIIDYGCSVGNYTFPLAELVGDSGKVYAVDINRHVLRELERKAQDKNAKNIECIMPEGSYRLGIEDGSTDGFLIYDLFHMLRSSGIIDNVLDEADRVLAPGGIISILPFHMSDREKADMCRMLADRKYELLEIQRGAGLHFEMQMYSGSADYERGDIYQFAKAAAHRDR